MKTTLSSDQIIDYIIDPIITINKSSHIIQYVNYEAESFLKKSREFLIRKHLNDFFIKSSVLIDSIQKSLLQFGNYIFSDVEIFVNGKNKIVNIEIINNEKLDYLIIVLKLKKNIVQKNNEDDLFFLDNVFSILCHELKNPLTSIRLASQLLEKKESDNELTEIIVKECDRIKNLVDSFQINLNADKIENKKYNIHEIIRYVLKKLELKNLRGIKIIEEFDPSLPELSINKNNLIIVMDNIIDNSLNALKSVDGYIKIKTSFVFKGLRKIPGIKSDSKNNYIKIIIEDNGDGINELDLKSIFYPFFSTRIDGKGIGLFLVKKLIKHFGGSIIARSDKNITQFEILLPVS